jgi:hypothetical protein
MTKLLFVSFILDIDECASRTLHQCGIGAKCVNRIPGYVCECPAGYQGDGRTGCLAAEVRTGCESDFDCTNNAQCGEDGSCRCRSGFETTGAICIDINECQKTPDICGPKATCTNTVGSFECRCQSPLVGNPPKEPCKDACLDVNCGKHSKCQIEGIEAFCVCDEGWTYNPKEISAGCIGKFSFRNSKFNVIYFILS